MSTVSQTLSKVTEEAVRPKGVSWFRRVMDRCLDRMGLRAPVGYEDEDGFHYGSLPLAEQERIARKNMSQGETTAPPAAPVQTTNSQQNLPI
jgi:hypothetical protein